MIDNPLEQKGVCSFYSDQNKYTLSKPGFEIKLESNNLISQKFYFIHPIPFTLLILPIPAIPFTPLIPPISPVPLIRPLVENPARIL